MDMRYLRKESLRRADSTVCEAKDMILPRYKTNHYAAHMIL